MTVHGRGQGCGVVKKSCFIVQTEADDIICKDCEVTYQVSYMQYSISVFVQTGEHTSLRLLINFCQHQHSCKFRYGHPLVLLQRPRLPDCLRHAALAASWFETVCCPPECVSLTHIYPSHLHGNRSLMH